MAIKWFCDICGREIEAPEWPIYVKAYSIIKSRDNETIGWSESEEIRSASCHKECADTLTTEVIEAFERARRVMKNNAN